MKQRRSIGRTIVKASIFLLLGAIVNIAVAWGCVWHAQRPRDLVELLNGVVVVSHSPLSTLSSDPGVVRTWQTSRSMAVTWVGRVEPLDRKEFHDRLPYWSALKRADLPDCAMEWVGPTADTSYFREMGAGLPAIALYGATVHDEYPAPEQHFGMLELPITQSDGMRRLVVPFRPLWPGFAINTIFYAAILWLLFAAPFALRRRRRIKRGLCPACAYPVGASDLCPECGNHCPHPVLRAKSMYEFSGTHQCTARHMFPRW